MSLVASTGSLMLLPLYVTKMLVPSVVARPLAGDPPTVDLMMGYNKSVHASLRPRFSRPAWSESLATLFADGTLPALESWSPINASRE